MDQIGLLCPGQSRRYRPVKLDWLFIWPGSVARLDGMTRWTRRIAQLYFGLTLYGLSGALMLRAGLGLDPWNVLHEGIALLVHHAIGTVSIVVGALVLLLWIPLRQRPGLGTISNVFVLGLVQDQALELIPNQHGLDHQVPMLIGAILLCGVATGMYISADLGPGPRDGLMTGVSARLGWSIRLTRTLIEATVLATGWLLGGSVGIGTVLFALGIGPAAQFFLRLLRIPAMSALPETVPIPA
jgi:uncharacterized membrane protein YczE